MDKQEIYIKMLRVKREKSTAIDSKGKYETFRQKIDNLIVYLNKIINGFDVLVITPQGISVDSSSIDNGKVTEMKERVEQISVVVDEIKYEINSKIEAIDIKITSLDREFRRLNNQYESLQ